MMRFSGPSFVGLLRVFRTTTFLSLQLNFIAKNNWLVGDDHEY